MPVLYKTEKAVINYINVNNAKSKIKLIALFARDALVIDEGMHYKGIDAIKRWRKKVNAAHDITLEMVGGSPDKEGLYADILCTGHFPGSPLIIEYHFIVKNNLITYLKIS
jgi:hypothetical protein